MTKQILTQEELKSQLHYDPDTGIFTRTKTLTNCCKIGDVAGSKLNNGYIIIRVLNKKYLAHRLAWLYMTGNFPSQTIDHINRIKDDNRLCNLRHADQSHNNLNVCKNVSNTSGYKGVNWNKNRKKWAVRCTVNGERIFLGYFDDVKLANIAYDDFAKKHHGEFYYGHLQPTSSQTESPHTRISL
jgi:hypothetical protein